MRSGRRMACAAIQRASVVRIFAEAPYLRSLAALVALCALLEALLDYTLSAAAVARLGRGEALVGDLVPALRRAASHCTGQLVDALFDDRVDPVVRRRIPRVLASVTTQRAVDGAQRLTMDANRRMSA